jgi:predicted pyridoxine 5'-phosphate oxidase superfamily flavin-nucleotide-binding protein
VKTLSIGTEVSHVRPLPEDFAAFFDNLCGKDKPLVWISTLSRDGTPHVVPTCFVKLVSDKDGNKKIAIGGIFIRQTVRNLIRNQNISVGSSAKFSDGFHGYLVKGRAEVSDSGSEFEELKKIIYDLTKGRRTIRWMILVSLNRIYSLDPNDGKKRIW